MLADIDCYTKQEIIDAFFAYMEHVESEEGTTFVTRYAHNRYPNMEDNKMTPATVYIIHAIDAALLEKKNGANTRTVVK